MSENTNNLINIPDLSPSINNAVHNLTDKPTLSVGTTFADLWYLVFGGISYLSEKKKLKYAHSLDLFRKQLESSIEQIPPEKVVDPSVQATAQALENSKYCIDEENLREMFVALISNSMNAGFQKDIHPAFAEILKQMSPFDAEIIKVFKDSKINGLPICQYELKTDKGFSTLLDHVFLEYPSTDLAACSLSISSLIRLGLLETTYTSWLLREDIYTPFEQHPWFKMLQGEFPDKKISIKKGRVLLTPLGRSFTKVCIPD